MGVGEDCIVLIWKWKSIVTMTYRLPDIFWLLFPPFMMIHTHCLSSTPDWVSASVQCHRCDVSLSTKAKCIGIACNGIHEILLQSSHSCFHSVEESKMSLAYNESPYFQGAKQSRFSKGFEVQHFPHQHWERAWHSKKFQANDISVL